MYQVLLFKFRRQLCKGSIKTRRRSEIKKTRSRTKQDFSEEGLSKQNTEAQLASLSYSSFQATTEWSAIFA